MSPSIDALKITIPVTPSPATSSFKVITKIMRLLGPLPLEDQRRVVQALATLVGHPELVTFTSTGSGSYESPRAPS